jgi:hypothetical protein
MEQIEVVIPPPTTNSTPSTVPTSQSAASTRPSMASYIDVVRAAYPQFPATQPLGVPVNFEEASRIILDEPIYIGPSKDLWITHPDAPPTQQVLANASDEQIHVLPDEVAFVFWTAEEDKDGKWIPHLICRVAGDRYEHVTAASRQPMKEKRAYDWARAFVWNDRIVVPTDHGVAMIDFAQPAELDETFYSLAEADAKDLAPPQVALDTRGLLAWIPWDAGQVGSAGASRYVDGKWTPLDASAGWPEKIIHLVPLLDGSVLRIVPAAAAGGDEKVELQIAALDAAQVDEQQIAKLVAQLSDPDDEVRTAAYNELTRYGPGLWPVLESMIEDQPAEAKVRLRQLLGSRIKPTLGGMTLLDDRLHTVRRYPDGGALFYAEGGASVPGGDGRDAMVVPAWISCRPGRAISLLPYALVRDVDPREYVLENLGSEWILVDPVLGPRRFMGNHLLSLLKKEELEFRDVVGVDRRGRWLFATAPSDKSQKRRRTLIIDPTLPDPTPRLPVWTMAIREGTVGWTKDNWPVIRRGSPWALEADKWRPMDEKKEKMFVEASPELDAVTPTTLPASTQSAGRALCVDEHGCTFFGGRESLVHVEPDGTQTNWPLPPEATALETYKPVLIAADGALFLFNQPGRVVQIAEAGDGQLAVKHIFTEHVPNTDHPQRIWLDPAGRIIIAHDTNQLAILFPSGRIPSAIRTLMMDDAE